MITHFLQVPMTGLGLRGGYRGDTWLKRRLRVFHEYVLMAITNNPDIKKTIWFCWRPEEKENPIVQEFQQQMSKIYGVDVMHTFTGILFYDDKYEEIEAQSRLKRACEAVPSIEGEVRITLQPSDDCYIDLKEIQEAQGDIVGYLKGYIMNYATKEIAEYNPNTSPPFYTLVFNGLNASKYYERVRSLKSHEDAGLHRDFTALPGRGFIVGVHGENISTTFTHRFKGRTLEKEEAEQLMASVGILHSNRLRFSVPWRLRLRNIFNKMPGREVIGSLYHSLPAKYQKL